jgi:hypothetical protein
MLYNRIKVTIPIKHALMPDRNRIKTVRNENIRHGLTCLYWLREILYVMNKGTSNILFNERGKFFVPAIKAAAGNVV